MMRSFSITALLLLAIIAECLGAHERSRQRSSPSRSVPVAADVKRQANFDCPEEFGYYPHPTDCTLYYVCVFGGALLESCTGGLMYSHELQTCDWPRNVGCDATGAVVADDLERLNEREPPPPPPRRNPPPPPPRVQPNPVITSRGQPKFNRQEYEKQQQLYAEVDDLPPVEEIENDRQQRVYRGQPSTIGQVQKDRDGYIGQVITSGRTLNSNIIPSSINQNTKIGSFSFGTQIDEKKTAAITPAPQTYRGDQKQYATDSFDNQKDLKTNITEIHDYSENTISRRKRDVTNVEQALATNLTEVPKGISKRVDDDEVIEYDEEENSNVYHEDGEDGDRDKRQVRFYLKNAFKGPGKNWAQLKPIKMSDIQQYNYNPNTQSFRNQPLYSASYNRNNNQQAFAGNYLSTINPLISYQSDNYYSERPFKASLPDFSNQKLPPVNIATQIITKSPPISSLHNNPFLNGNFYHNAFKGNNQNNQASYSQVLQSTRQPSSASYPDSAQVPSFVVTNNPLQIVPLKNANNDYPINKLKPADTNADQQSNRPQNFRTPENKRPLDNEEDEYDDEDLTEEDDENDDESDSVESDRETPYNFKPDYQKLPFEYTHPKNKFANIENPFASPNFDFDSFIAKLQGNTYSTTFKTQNKVIKMPNAYQFPSSTFKYDGISTPKPFTVNRDQNVVTSTPKLQTFQQQLQRPIIQKNNQGQQYSVSSSGFSRVPQKDAVTPLEALRPKIKPPNFNDDRQLPISYNFKTPIGSSDSTYETQKLTTNTQKPHDSTSGLPIIFKDGKNGRFVSFQPNSVASDKPYLISSENPKNAYIFAITPSAPNPTTQQLNEHLSTLQNYWKNPTTRAPVQNESDRLQVVPISKNLSTSYTVTGKPTHKRKLIPKPSPEMNDYYYDDEDEQYYYEPAVKPKYMPISEIKPQRPQMAQNYQEYDDLSQTTLDQGFFKSNSSSQKPLKYNSIKQSYITKNQNDLSYITKNPYKSDNTKIPIPVMVDFSIPPSTNILIPESRNRTYHIRKPTRLENSANTLKPPKYLNQTTVRPYTVRHRLAKPTTVVESSNIEGNKPRGRVRHPNIVAMQLTTPRDSYKQETRFTKTQHDDRTNSLEPTESITPSSYLASPQPKMLYNGSQTYSPDQYDPYYAVYDEDGELYKDSDYVQQYNTASLRPAVQQTYRGTPPSPPARRPETYTPRPVSPDDYDDALIQGQINNQNQYQTSIRQSTRGEGNELSYDHNLSGVRTTIYEATTPTTLSTPPSTTSTTITTTTTTTTTTPRPTTAQFTEALTPSRYTPRSSDESRSRSPVSSSNKNSFDESNSSEPSSPKPSINFSSFAKPFEKTDNSSKLNTDIQSTETVPTFKPRTTPTKTLDRKDSLEIISAPYDKNEKKIISLTTGFSIRRNTDDNKNPYTLTLISRPFNNEHLPIQNLDSNTENQFTRRNHYDTSTNEKVTEKRNRTEEVYLEQTTRRFEQEHRRRKYNTPKINHDEVTISEYRLSKETTTEQQYTTPPTTKATKYYLKTVHKRPATTSSPVANSEQSALYINTERVYDSETTPEPIILHPESNSKWNQYNTNEKIYDLNESPYKHLNNLRNFYDADKDITPESSSSTTTSTILSPSNAIYSTTDKPANQDVKSAYYKKPKPSYYLYHLEDDVIADQTTEIFGGNVKNILKSFLNDVSSKASNDLSSTSSSSSPIEYTSPNVLSLPKETEKTVNIGYQKKKKLKYADEKPLRSHYKHLEILTEPTVNQYLVPTLDPLSFISTEKNPDKALPPRIESTTVPMESLPLIIADEQTIQDYETPETDTKYDKYLSKFSGVIKSQPKITESRKYYNIVNEDPREPLKNENNDLNYNQKIDLTENTVTNIENIKTSTEPTINEPLTNITNDYNVITTTIRSTTTQRTEKETKPTKSLSFPTRASRINPAIKLAATSSGGGRRSYQSSSNCSSDNSLQDNPKCNEIKYQRPSSTRGRGSAHYSTSGGSEAQPPNRGTPPTRNRPTLKPSTAIVSKTAEAIQDIYLHPPSRPSAVYPQPTPDKTAAKCRKDVCLLPDCFCGGKDIPGNLPVNEVPQMVLITFDDAVNDLNKVYYEEFFERGRVNPNGCPITGTFYVSHEWTDYSQVQNLYADGHEFASHTISHSFGEQFSQKKWNREVGGQREILSAYGGVKLDDVRGMRAPFLSVGGNKMFKMLYDSNFTYDSSMPVYENKPPSWPYTLDYKLFHDCMIPPCPTKSYPGVWEVPMVMWQDLNGGRCSMGDACANPSDAEGVYKMILKNFDRHYTSNRAPFGLFYHAAWFTQPHHKEGFIMFLDFINQMQDVWIVTNWQALQWVRDPTPISRLNSFQPFQCNYADRPKKCNNPKVCNLWHKSGVRYMRTCQPCPEQYPWTGKTGIRSSRIDNEVDE